MQPVVFFSVSTVHVVDRGDLLAVRFHAVVICFLIFSIKRQRLLIARALAGDPEILILDDASSALDYKTDANLRRTIREELSTTTVVVAQRVSSVMFADHILVLDHGRIIGAGTHEELLVQCSAYREISESQMGGAFLE